MTQRKVFVRHLLCSWGKHIWRYLPKYTTSQSAISCVRTSNWETQRDARFVVVRFKVLSAVDTKTAVFQASLHGATRRNMVTFQLLTNLKITWTKTTTVKMLNGIQNLAESQDDNPWGSSSIWQDNIKMCVVLLHNAVGLLLADPAATVNIWGGGAHERLCSLPL